jgi:hypothetical protein
MGILTREELLRASDLIEREVPVSSIGGSVRVRSLPAAYSNQAQSEALEMQTGPRGEQTASVNTQKLEELQMLHGLIDPKLETIEDVRTFSLQCGLAWREIIKVIDEISGVDKEAIEKANATFQPGGSAPAGEVVGNGTADRGSGPDLPVRAGAAAAHADR